MIFDQRMNFPSHPMLKRETLSCVLIDMGNGKISERKLQLFHLRRLLGRGGGKGIKIRISEAFIII